MHVEIDYMKIFLQKLQYVIRLLILREMCVCAWMERDHTKKSELQEVQFSNLQSSLDILHMLVSYSFAIPFVFFYLFSFFNAQLFVLQ